jgi:hypothetical protein
MDGSNYLPSSSYHCDVSFYGLLSVPPVTVDELASLLWVTLWIKVIRSELGRRQRVTVVYIPAVFP